MGEAPDISAPENAAARVAVLEGRVRELETRAESLERAEQKQRESETRLRFALKSARLGSWDLSIASERLMPDARFAEIFGYREPRPRWSYADLLTHVVPEDRDEVDRRCRRAMRNRSELRFECRVQRVDGELRWIEVAGSCHGEGDDARLLGVVADVSERKRSEQALRESEARYRIMGETVPYGVWLADPEGRCEYLSRSFLELVGRPLEEMQGLGWTDVLAEEDVPAVHDDWLRAVEMRQPWERELRVEGTDGCVCTLLMRGLPVRDESGRVSCWVGILLDISARKAVEEELADSRGQLLQQMRRLEEGDRRKNEFLAILGHELRNPLAALSNGVRILRSDKADAEAIAWTREMLEHKVAHLARLVDDLLDITRITRGVVPLRSVRFSLREALLSAVDGARPLMEQRGHQFDISLPVEPLPLEGDPARLEQVALNLLTNAARYTPPGGHVGLAASRQGGRVEIVVEDTGHGLGADTLERIFEPFTQIRGSSIAGGGLGVGLTIVRQLVELHGGKVWAQSRGLGRGSTFTVSLPLLEDAADTAEEVGGGPPQVLEDGVKVLVVDDNTDAAMALGMLLEAADCDVETAYTGGSALEKARGRTPDVVLLDIGLPDMTGLEVAQQLRQDPSTKGSLLIAVTGFGHDDIVKRVKEAGFDMHLLKPVDPDVLFELIAGAKKQGA